MAYAGPEALLWRVQSDAVRLAQSRAQVHTSELFIGRDPAPLGLYSADMGTTDLRYNCRTCGHKRGRCQGHPGVVQLPFPLLLPYAVEQARKWLRIVCPFCSTFLVDPGSARIQRAPAARRLNIAAATTTPPLCPHCRRLLPRVVKSKEDNFSTYLVLKRDDDSVQEVLLLPYHLERIFSRVSDEGVLALGVELSAHPRNFLVRWLQVPPVLVRPAVRLAGANYDAASHDINGLLQYIVKAANIAGGDAGAVALPAPHETPSEQLVQQTLVLQQLLYDLHRGSAPKKGPRGGGRRGIVAGGGKPVDSLGRRHKQKTGRLRRHLVAGRVWSIARCTISGNSQLHIREMAMPEAFACKLQLCETVTAGNHERLMRFFLNGRRQYPGAARVWRAATGTTHDVDGLRDGRLEPGDKLFRDLVTGDLVFFNRQPSLERSSITVHRLVVLRHPHKGAPYPAPPEMKTFGLNVIDCSYYNADFDGDEMNVTFPATAKDRAEASVLGGVAAAFISTKTSAPVLGTVQDSTLGGGLLPGVDAFDKSHAMALFDGSDFKPDFSDLAPAYTPGDARSFISGREAVSRLLRRFPTLSLSRKPTVCSQVTAPYLAPPATRTVIRRGRLLQGPLDKAIVGSGASGGVFHRISREYGPDAAIDCLWQFQQLTIAYLDMRGISLSIVDMMLEPERQAEVREIIGGMLREAELINRDLVRGKIVAPLGMTVHQYYEKRMVEALKVPDMILGPILQSIDPSTNGLFLPVAYGSKGNYKNVSNIMGAVGQITINGGRIEPRGTGRTLVYFARGDLSPAACGFVCRSYVDGLTSTEHFNGAKNGRNDLTHKALSTALTGHANRLGVLATQSAGVDALRAVILAGSGRGVQLLYGGDGMDARQVEPIAFPTWELDDVALRAEFAVPGLDAAWHRAELDALRDDRDRFRQVGLRVEGQCFSYAASGRVFCAVDVRSIAAGIFESGSAADGDGADGADGADGVAAADADPPVDAAALEALQARVARFCAEAPYLLLNRRAREAGTPVPPHLRQAVAHFCRVVRAELATVRLWRARATPQLLEAVCAAMELRYLRSLVSPGEAVGVLAAQAISEPQTQYMLDSHHRSVTDGTNKAGVTRPKEIMGAAPPEKERTARMLFRGLAPGPDGRLAVTNDPGLLKELADSVKLLNLVQLAERWDVLYERFPAAELAAGDSPPVAADDAADDAAAEFHPAYTSDWAWMRHYLRANPLLRPPDTLTFWGFRVVIDRMRLVMKSVSLETVVTRLQRAFPAAYLLHSPEGWSQGAPQIVLRVYLDAAAFRRPSASSKPVVPQTVVDRLLSAFLEAPVRGLPGVIDARVVQMSRHAVRPGGGLAMEPVYLVQTTGSNLAAALLHRRIDNASLVTSSIGETIKQFGIRAGRARIIYEIREVLGDSTPNLRHLELYADLMTLTGAHTSLTHTGLNLREPHNVLLNALTYAPMNAYTRGALGEVVNPLVGMAAPLMVGGMPHYGTRSVTLTVDSTYVQKHRRSVKQIVDSL